MFNHFFCIAAVLAIYVFQSSLSLAYSQSSNNDSSLYDNFLTYYNPFTMIKIQYPSFWEVYEILDSKTVSFISPLKTTGVIVHNMPTPGESPDEVLMKMLVKIKTIYQMLLSQIQMCQMLVMDQLFRD